MFPNHRVHDRQQTSTEKHTMACTRKSLRLDRATLGGTPSCIQGGAPCYTQGVNLPTVEVVLQLELSAFTCRTDEAIVTSSQNRKHCNSGALIHPPDRRNKALPVSAPARRGKSLQTPSCWSSVRHFFCMFMGAVTLALGFCASPGLSSGCLRWVSRRVVSTHQIAMERMVR